MKLQVKLGSFETVLNIALTDAPKNYDGFQTFTIQDFDYPLGGCKNNSRIVGILDEHSDWQIGRYGSGMNRVIVGEEFDKEFPHFTEQYLITLLWNDMRSRNF